MLTSIMFVTVYVTDQDRALTFYTEGLGLEKRIDYPGLDGRFLTVGVAGSPVEIILWRHEPAAGQPIDSRPDATPGPLILESDDLRKDFDVFRRRGVEFTQAEPMDYPFGIRVEAVDPDGNRISLRQRRRADG
ncbi:catechol 2,3-dioxygenase-like lactoylglutathione lyase family enzyme [Nocardia transvalensis]|uniref:Catechol 2,3-dioxygenase-like lactoylglutathione lyase family enzyme n=1 Tax=Nocardia transvalensis TaxID=37333 RepID=A0A7W9UGW2_9NOCA|nr:VOC family protein [Nocardia transvalensis]MBB5912497.1 catechol 2,3-dioxygenase-like lactoylglutathione lyase family enzyme [Nocardia transvalensis]